MGFLVTAGASLIGISIYKSLERVFGHVDQTWPCSAVLIMIGIGCVYFGVPA